MPKKNMRIGEYAGAGRWCAVLPLGASKRGAYWQPYWVCAVVNPLMRGWRRRVINGWGFPLCCHVGVRQRKMFSWLGVNTSKCAGGTHGVVAPGGRDAGS